MKRILFIFLLISTLTSGQQPFNLAFNHLNHEGGLSNNNVFYLHRDSRGYMWLSTLNGLTRFDGTACKVYSTRNSGLKGMAIKSIVEDKAGNLWIGSDAGLNFYNRRLDTFTYLTVKEFGEYTAYPYTIDHQGKLWFHMHNTNKGGMYVYDPVSKKTKLISTITASNFCPLKKQAFEPVNTYYVSGPNDTGFYKVSLENYRVEKAELFFNGKNNLPSLNHIGDYLAVENDTTVWISGDNGLGLIRFNPLNLKQKIYKSPNNKSLTRLVFYKNYLILGSNEGIHFFDKKEGKFVQRIRKTNTKTNGISSDYSEILYIDAKDNLFLSNLGPGLDYTNLNHKILEHWLDPETSEGLGYKLNDIYEIRKGDDEIFVKYQTGPNMVIDLNGKFLRKYENSSTVLVDSKKKQWMYETGVLSSYDPETFTHKKYALPFLKGSNGYEVQLVEVAPHTYLLSGKKGMGEFNETNGKVTEMADGNSKNTYLIKPLYYDASSGKLFASTSFWSKVIVLEKKGGIWNIIKTFENINAYAFKKSNTPGFVWLCTKKGLMHLNTKTFESNLITDKDGLPDNFVSDFIEEPNGDYWIVTSKGISHFDHLKKTYRSFTSKDGAYSSEYDWGCAIKLNDGRVVFGGTNGITVISPQILFENSTKPVLEVKNFTVNGKPMAKGAFIAESKEVVLESNQNSFTFELVGIDYNSPKSDVIWYKLDGYDTDWIVGENPTEARYSNVPEGSYTFFAKAGAPNQMKYAQTKAYKIYIKTPFYRTWWFRLLVGLTLGGLVYGFYRFRINQLLRLQEVRNRISTDLHDEIGATLSGIGILSTVAQQKITPEHPAHTLMSRISEDAQNVGNAID